MKNLCFQALLGAMRQRATGFGRAAIALGGRAAPPAAAHALVARSPLAPTINPVARDLALRWHLTVASDRRPPAPAKTPRLHCAWSVDADGRLACRWEAGDTPARFSGGNGRSPPAIRLVLRDGRAA